MIRAALLALALGAGPALAQTDDGSVLIVPPEDDGTIIRPMPREDGESLLEPDLDLEFVPDPDIPEEPQIAAVTAAGAVVRALDRAANEVRDLDLSPGQTAAFGHIQVTLGECRYPEGNPSGDAYAFLVIRPEGKEEPLFQGWMIASSPALNAMDHARYDVWLLSCRID